MSEGGVGWVNMLADRADYVLDHSGSGHRGRRTGPTTRRPSEVLGGQFWFCSIDDPSTLDGVLERFGPDHVLLEVDYPHADSTWPDTQTYVHDTIGHLPADVVEQDHPRRTPRSCSDGRRPDPRRPRGRRHRRARCGRRRRRPRRPHRPGRRARARLARGRRHRPRGGARASSTSTPTTTPSSPGTRRPARRRCTASPPCSAATAASPSPRPARSTRPT